MALSNLDLYFLIAVIVIGTILGYLLSGRSRLYFEIGGIIAISVIFILLGLQVIEENNQLGYLMFISVMVVLILYGYWLRTSYKRPMSLLSKQFKMLEENDLSYMIDRTKFVQNGEIKKLYENQKLLVDRYKKTIMDLKLTERSITTSRININDTAIKIGNSSETMSNDIDEIVQTAVLVNELGSQLNTIVSELSNNFTQKIGELKDIIKSVEIISEQTNLIAVNASIEAAHAKGVGDNFSIVADGIQRLSQRSRMTTDKLQKSSDNITLETQQKIHALMNQFNQLDDISFQIAELSDKLSSISHDQISITQNMNSEVTSMTDNLDKISKILEQFKI